MSQVTVNGNTYSSAGESAKDMRSGGHRTHLLPLLADAVVDLAAKVTAAQLAETNAEAAAASALTAPGTQATSATSLAIATGSKSFTIQTGKSFSPGQAIIAASDAAPATNYMWGLITSYNSGTGALVLAISVIGGSGTHADWTLSLSPNPTANNLNAAQNFARATVASHATTADIWGAAGNQIDWTGTATTTAFPNAPQAGAERVLICAGACSFTAGANMLIDGVASAATVTCAAGDSVIVRAVSTTQFKLSRVKYDGTAQVSGGASALVPLAKIVATSASTIDFSTQITSAYETYLVKFYGVTVGNSVGTLNVRLKKNGSYQTTDYSVSSIVGGDNGADNPNDRAATAQSSLNLTYNQNTFVAGGSWYASGEVWLTNANSAGAYKQAVHGSLFSVRADGVIGNGFWGTSFGANGAAFAVTGIQFLDVGASNPITGTFELFGLTSPA